MICDNGNSHLSFAFMMMTMMCKIECTRCRLEHESMKFYWNGWREKQWVRLLMTGWFKSEWLRWCIERCMRSEIGRVCGMRKKLKFLKNKELNLSFIKKNGGTFFTYRIRTFVIKFRYITPTQNTKNSLNAHNIPPSSLPSSSVCILINYLTFLFPPPHFAKALKPALIIN